MQEVIDSARFVAQRSGLVKIRTGALEGLARRLTSGRYPVPPWDRRHHFFDNSERTLFYLFVLDTLNFCFWPPGGGQRWEVPFGSEVLSGYHALAGALSLAMERGVPLDDSRFLSDIDTEKLKQVLGGKGDLQLMEERRQCINELGRFLLDRYHGSPAGLVEDAESSAVSLARGLCRHLSSFNDTAQYEGRRVFFLKRAQILAADIHGSFEGRKWGRFTDMERLTIFADYKLPQVLRHMGVLEYAKGLAQKVEKGILLESGGREEVEIRASTILAAELLRSILKDGGRELTAPGIDWILWNLGQLEGYRKRPYHRTLSIFY